LTFVGELERKAELRATLTVVRVGG
jgi:hypothetical protein